MSDQQTRLIVEESFPRKPGQTLPNGAILLAETVIRTYDHRRDSIVLCVVPGAVYPFVSWHRCVGNDSPKAAGGFELLDYCYIGHNKLWLDEAWEAYNARVEEKQEALEGKERVRNDHA
jgi:hypothetical protein